MRLIFWAAEPGSGYWRSARDEVLVGSRHGDLLVTRYYVTVNETRDGGTVQTHAPRLTVFRQEAGRWLVVAHANFAALDK